MATSSYGWCGKILKIDLSNSRITVLQTMDYAGRFLGGRGIATRLYWELVKPEIKAFDPATGDSVASVSIPIAPALSFRSNNFRYT